MTKIAKTLEQKEAEKAAKEAAKNVGATAPIVTTPETTTPEVVNNDVVAEAPKTNVVKKGKVSKTIEGNKIVKEVKENGRYLINTENGLTFNISEEEYLEYVK